MEAPYGFDEDAEARRLLRSRPPRVALEWAGRVLDGEVIEVRALRGGLSSAVHAVTVRRPQGEVARAVLRRYVRPELQEEEPDIAEREARTLGLVAALPVPAPRLLAVDAAGDAAGAPSLLMTLLPGRVDWSRTDSDRFLSRLAALLPQIHGGPVPEPGLVRDFATYEQARYEPPAWSTRPALWERAVQVAYAEPPSEPRVFIHRDFHPGNVLWRRGVVTGLVDWQSASIGPAVVDVGHCRANLLGYGRDVADRFTRIWESAAGATYNPWADVSAIIGWLDHLRYAPRAEFEANEDALARALADLGVAM